jgi:parallel beta-helix repeat protein
LDGGDERHGYVLHLQDAAFWILDGFTVRNGQKGVMLDGTSNTVLQNLTVQHVGDEAIHLRAYSSDNTLVGNTISATGLFKPKFGAGIYVGTETGAPSVPVPPTPATATSSRTPGSTS